MLEDGKAKNNCESYFLKVGGMQFLQKNRVHKLVVRNGG